MSKVDNTEFKLSQLRMDKIIYAVEACTVVLLSIFGYLFSNQYFSGTIQHLVNFVLIFLAVAYTIFMGIGNFVRLREVKKLEKQYKISV